jgi:Putative Flp pilus-assembly TadE/G-like
MIRHTGRPKTEGQVVVVFALSLITLLGFAGLAVDGGSTFAQRSNEQTASDLAALAGANDYLINGDLVIATARARDVAATNGFIHGTDSTAVEVDLDTGNGITFTVSIDAPHHNTMAAVMGMPIWTVSTTATALSGFPDSAYGASPFIFSADAFDTDGTPKYTTPTNFGEGNGDVPTSELDLAWTNYGTGNVDTTQVDQIIKGSLVIDKTLAFGEYIGQHNNGNHTYLYDDVNTYMKDVEVPVAIVDSSGLFVGWSTFHVISASGGTDKHVYGYFLADFESAAMSITSCEANDCPRYLGSYILKLTN